MKDLAYDELLKAPAKVQFIYMASMMKQPLGSKILNEAIEESPEYFPDELEHRRKWALVPESINAQYRAEREKLRVECYKDMPPSKGIIGWSMDASDNDYKTWSEAYQKCREIEKPLVGALHRKYYGPYGIEYTGWY